MVLSRKIAVAFICAGFVVVAACSGDSGEANTHTDGLTVYNNNCKSCHGNDGKLGLSGAADLSASTLTTEEKIKIVSDGKGGMMPYRELLSKQQIKAVVQHIETLQE